jgi:hypothetical protein
MPLPGIEVHPEHFFFGSLSLFAPLRVVAGKMGCSWDILVKAWLFFNLSKAFMSNFENKSNPKRKLK